MSSPYASLRNPYLVLGVAPTASVETIKAAMRDQAKKYHPDTNPDDPSTAAERLKEVTAAYQSVSDAERRRQVDLPWLKLRIPKGLTLNGPTPRPGWLSSLLGIGPKDGPGSRYFTYMHAGITCFRHPGQVLLDQAEVEFRRAVEVHPDAPEARYDLAISCYWRGRFDEAFTLLKEVARRMPEDEQVGRLAASLRPTD